MVLEQAKLSPSKKVQGLPQQNDIVENPNIKIIAMDAAMLPRTLEDADICVINSNYALEGNLNPATDAIFSEPKIHLCQCSAVRPADKDKGPS